MCQNSTKSIKMNNINLSYYVLQGYRILKTEGPGTLFRKTGRSIRRSVSDFRRQLYIKDKYRLDRDPSRIIHVDPIDIIYETRSKMGSTLDEPNVVCGGRWDTAVAKFKDRYKVRALVRHFKQDVNWKETEYYNRKLATIRANETWRGCNSKDDLDGFFQRIDSLFEIIRDEGYKTQAELLAESPEKTKDLNNDAAVPIHNEIGINIGRSGEFLWQNKGQHRLCIAQLLNLDYVPVQVLTRHKEWQNIRNKVNNLKDTDSINSRMKKYLTHPDICNST